MAKDQIISQNQFISGMNQDILSSLTDHKTYRYARNAINSNRDNKGFGLTNEGGTIECSTLPDNVVGAAYCDERNWTFFFTSDNEIKVLRHSDCELLDVMSSDEFGCDWKFKDCEWIGKNVEFKSMDPGNNLFIYFSANNI